MTYRIRGLDPAPFTSLFDRSDEELRSRGAMRFQVTDRPGFPCRISLDDVPVGKSVILLNHVSHDIPNAYRTSHAIFVEEGAREAAEFIDEIPPALERRLLSLRAFDADGMMSAALLVQPGEADAGIRQLFEAPETAYIHAHNAVRGCFAARVERS